MPILASDQKFIFANQCYYSSTSLALTLNNPWKLIWHLTKKSNENNQKHSDQKENNYSYKAEDKLSKIKRMSQFYIQKYIDFTRNKNKFAWKIPKREL